MHGTIDQMFAVEWRPLAELDAIATQWRALAARALEPNVFYEPAFARAAAPVFGENVGAGLVWGRGAPRQLLGFFPARIERRRFGVLPVLVGWTHPFAPLATPLIDCDAGAGVISAWLDHVTASPDLPNFLLMPYLPVEGLVGQAFDAAVTLRNGSCVSFNAHRRALLAPNAGPAHYLDEAIGAKKRKELRRQRKRLAETGTVSSITVETPADVAIALDDFLALEAAGWKIAYDESRARFSPGVQLLTDVTQSLLEDPGIARADSCATADHPMIDHVWRERLVLSDRLLRLTPDRSPAFVFAVMTERLRRSAITGAKALRNLARRRLRTSIWKARSSADDV